MNLTNSLEINGIDPDKLKKTFIPKKDLIVNENHKTKFKVFSMRTFKKNENNHMVMNVMY